MPGTPGPARVDGAPGLVGTGQHTYSPDMKMTQSRPALLAPGNATEAATGRYRDRFAARFASDHFRTLAGDLHASSIGLGTYLGECDDTDDDRYTRTIRLALRSGVNVIDSAINYRCQRSEQAVGVALREAVSDGIARDEVIVCTKGGYLPLDGTPPASRADYKAYVQREFLDPGIIAPGELVVDGHCIAPAYLDHQIDRSRENLGVATIDLYYVHNPEQQLDAVDPAEFGQRIRRAFEALEQRVAAGDIGSYGCATWQGFRVDPAARGYLSLSELVDHARAVAGEAHHFTTVQLPINLGMTEAFRSTNQCLPGGRWVSLVEAASELGISVVASATLLQSKLAGGLPKQVRDAFPDQLTDAARAIAFVRGVPAVSVALVGMKSRSHLEQNLTAAH